MIKAIKDAIKEIKKSMGAKKQRPAPLSVKLRRSANDKTDGNGHDSISDVAKTNMVQCCSKYLSSLQDIAKKESPSKFDIVQKLIQKLIDGLIDSEKFKVTVLIHLNVCRCYLKKNQSF